MTVKTKSIDFLFGGKVQEARFSPDGKKVAFVYQRNLYVKDLAQNTVKQITEDGSEHIINGLTDWVYEEEFGFVRAFDWSADSNSIAFMRFDETDVPEFSMDIYGQDLYQYPYTFKYPKAGEKNAKVSLHHYQLSSGSLDEITLGDEAPYYCSTHAVCTAEQPFDRAKHEPPSKQPKTLGDRYSFQCG